MHAFLGIFLTSVSLSFCSIPPHSEGQQEELGVLAAVPGPVELTEAIASITTAQKVYSESKLPPTLPVPHKRWVPEPAPDVPHDQHAYFPMSMYK
jgi:hypothetical protein